jgi:hypothetical protein
MPGLGLVRVVRPLTSEATVGHRRLTAWTAVQRVPHGGQGGWLPGWQWPALKRPECLPGRYRVAYCSRVPAPAGPSSGQLVAPQQVPILTSKRTRVDN